MNNTNIEQLADQIKSLGHRVRLHIIKLLHEKGELSVTQIYENLEAEQALISHHLDKLYNRKLLLRRRTGKSILYWNNPESEVGQAILALIHQL